MKDGRVEVGPPPCQALAKMSNEVRPYSAVVLLYLGDPLATYFLLHSFPRLKSLPGLGKIKTTRVVAGSFGNPH